MEGSEQPSPVLLEVFLQKVLDTTGGFAFINQGPDEGSNGKDIDS